MEFCCTNWSATFSGGADLPNDRSLFRREIGEDLFGDFATMNLYRTRKVKSNAHAVALDGNDAHDSDRRRRVSDDDFFTFATSDHKHWGTSCPGPMTRLPHG